jgi:hypothetical protein
VGGAEAQPLYRIIQQAGFLGGGGVQFIQLFLEERAEPFGGVHHGGYQSGRRSAQKVRLTA